MNIKNKFILPVTGILLVGFSLLIFQSGNVLKGKLVGLRNETSEYILSNTYSTMENLYYTVNPGGSGKIDPLEYMSRLDKINKQMYAHKIGSSYPFVIKSDGKMVSYIEESTIGKDLKLKDKKTGEPLLPLFKKSAGKSCRYFYTKPGQAFNDFYEKEAYVEYYRPMDIYIVYSVYLDEEDSIVAETNKTLIITALITFIVLFIAIYILTNSIVTGIKITEAQISEVAQGDGDLTKRLKIKSKDEMGALASSFNSFIELLFNIVKNIKKSIIGLENVKDKITINNQESVSALNQISTNISNITQHIVTLDNEVKQADSEIDSMVKEFRNLDEQIESQGANIEESSSAITQMISSISSVADITQKKQNTTQSLVEISKNGGEKLEVTTRVIEDINQSVDAISEMAVVIKSIASQTDLLSMNAAIEAAHAGDAGKGFAVVADEIRKLAEDSKENSVKIAEVLKVVVDNIQKAKDAGAQTSNAFKEINREIMETVRSFQEITMSTEELSVGGKQILEAMSQLQSISSTVLTLSKNMRGSTDTLHTTLDKTSKMSEMVRAGIEEIEAGSNDVNRAVMEIDKLTLDLIEKTENLTKESNKFTTE